MAKQNTALLLSRYIWLIDTISSAGYITRDEIDIRWSRFYYVGGIRIFI